MEILITNDDGYSSKGIKVLAEIMSAYGNVTVIAPKTHQSGMSMALNLDGREIEFRHLGNEEAGCRVGDWSYLDATPASCVKMGLNTCFLEKQPDVIVSGINHGSNAATAACYSGTLGAAEEGALNGIPSIGVSLDNWSSDADFSVVSKYFPAIFEKIYGNLSGRNGIYYNVNFPDIPAERIKGVRVGRMGLGRWVREFIKRSGDENASTWVMVGDYMDNPDNHETADHLLMKEGYISIVALQLDSTDYQETERMKSKGFNIDF